ncbi:hypothetical protein CYLTODRAFT_446215 [Cylindrobasidium torrendii FP15055 ss-10]|uniref:Uncharacterized protein n=1 Tax=Cylindrobasidium torrendii FP15055 ss-10 TaxID=1314674 RepID=A0A0D7B1L0_9AGAR|nr:hypothetical protein CYLTODRAFT_446215 [Cylindrobasidium torrendii FP15055 ss-10]
MAFVTCRVVPRSASITRDPAPTPPQPVRRTTLDADAVEKLEKRLTERPAKEELIEKNILKDDKGIAPSLVAAKEALQRSQLEDKLDQALQHRPKPEELVKDGILYAAMALHLTLSHSPLLAHSPFLSSSPTQDSDLVSVFLNRPPKLSGSTAATQSPSSRSAPYTSPLLLANQEKRLPPIPQSSSSSGSSGSSSSSQSFTSSDSDSSRSSSSIGSYSKPTSGRASDDLAALFALLKRANADVQTDITRVKQSIGEARVLVKSCAQQLVDSQTRRSREVSGRANGKPRPISGTKELGHDFWLNM